MTTVSFAGVTIRCWQAGKLDSYIQFKKTQLLSGEFHVAIGMKTTQFPLNFQCYAMTDAELSAIEAQILNFGTLIVDGVSYTNCFIASLGSIHEESSDSGIWTYSLQIDHADVY